MATAVWVQQHHLGFGLDSGVSAHVLIKPVRGFRIQVDNNDVTEVRNLFEEEAEATTSLSCSDGCFYFLLVDDEVVAKVAHSIDDRRAAAIRFHTNLRVSQWFGSFNNGNEDFHYAPHDGCEFDSEEEAASSTDLPDLRDVCVLQSTSQLQQEKAFYSATCDVGSILIRCSDRRTFLGSVGVEVLSKREHDLLIKVQDKVSLPTCEHIVGMLPNERLVGVSCEFFSATHKLSRIRFETTRRMTPWFGIVSGRETVSASYCCGPDEFICGIFSSPSDSISFGVVVATAKPTQEAAS